MPVSEILSRPPPRSVRLTAYGLAAYGFIVALLSAMVLGPGVSFLLQDRADRTLLERGVLTHFDMTASQPTRQGDAQRIDYVFEARDATRGTATQRRGQSVVRISDMAAFANPRNRNVLYDPDDPGNATPVTSKSALSRRRDFDRRFALLVYPIWLALIFSFSAVGVRFLRRKLRLLRSGQATAPIMTRCQEGRARVEFQFTDKDGNNREGCQSFNFRVGLGASFTPYLRDGIVFFDRDNPTNCELFLPLVSTFRFVQT